jgi:mannose/cellobiose epimerase-like protein (N-acyl-D-glucosamine 2-epimerase family)
LREAEALFSFFEGKIINPLGGFRDLDDGGPPTAPGYSAAGRPTRYLFSTTRIIHAFSIAHLSGRPGADVIVDHGMDFLWNGHRDLKYGGYYWGVGYDAPLDSSKQAYGHAFVLHYARPLAGVVAPTPSVMGTRRPQTGLAPSVLEGVICAGSGGRMGQREGWFLL